MANKEKPSREAILEAAARTKRPKRPQKPTKAPSGDLPLGNRPLLASPVAQMATSPQPLPNAKEAGKVRPVPLPNAPVNRRWIVWDTETTGLTLPSEAALETQPKIIELALAVLSRNAVTSRHVWLINPGEEITPEITKITGITNDDLRGKPSFAEVFPEVLEVFHGAHGMCSHNLPFDRTMLVNELRRIGKEYAFPYPPNQLCSVQAYHHLAGRNLKLTELYERVLGKPLAQTHRAMDDVNALVEILIHDKVCA